MTAGAVIGRMKVPSDQEQENETAHFRLRACRGDRAPQLLKLLERFPKATFVRSCGGVLVEDGLGTARGLRRPAALRVLDGGLCFPGSSRHDPGPTTVQTRRML